MYVRISGHVIKLFKQTIKVSYEWFYRFSLFKVSCKQFDTGYYKRTI